jgi:hypothetical protein
MNWLKRIMATFAVLTMLVGCSTSQSTAPTLENPSLTARQLLTTWLTTLQSEESVADIIAPNFQLQRADGSGVNREEYLANQASVSEFVIGEEIFAYQSGQTLTVRWKILVSEEIDGVLYENVDAPRLTVFEWIDGAWLIVGYANFNPVIPNASDTD